MRTLLLSLAILAAIASPLALAQSRGGGGGPPPGAGGGMGGPPMGMPSGNMGNSMGMGARNEMGSARSMDGSARAALRRDNARTPEQAMFGLSTADRAELLKDADMEMRKAFGAYQASLAKARHEETPSAVLLADNVSRGDMQAFGADTKARALEMKDADRRTRKAFGKLQSALARQQSLERAAGTASVESAFGTDTAARAKLQADAELSVRTELGKDQSTRAKLQATTKAKARQN